MKLNSPTHTTSVDQLSNAPVSSASRSPFSWIIGWGVYSMLALAYFGYQSAWLDTVCISR